MKTAASILLVSILLTACAASSAGPGSPGPGDLAGRTFLSTAVTRAGEPLNLVPGTRIRLVFDANGNLGASAGCNSIGGTWRLDGNILRFEGGSMTEMGCDEPRHAQDDWLATFLGSDPTLQLTGNDLTLTAGDTTVALLDREIADPDLPLLGTVWTLTGIISGDTVSSVPEAPAARIQIDADGRARIMTGCNEAGGQVVVDGDRMQIRDLITTERACDGPGGQIEQAMFAVLGADEITWTIDAAGLTLMAGPNGLMFGGAVRESSAGRGGTL
jgi:heat shock protein HslJ